MDICRCILQKKDHVSQIQFRDQFPVWFRPVINHFLLLDDARIEIMEGSSVYCKINVCKVNEINCNAAIKNTTGLTRCKEVRAFETERRIARIVIERRWGGGGGFRSYSELNKGKCLGTNLYGDYLTHTVTVGRRKIKTTILVHPKPTLTRYLRQNPPPPPPKIWEILLVLDSEMKVWIPPTLKIPSKVSYCRVQR